MCNIPDGDFKLTPKHAAIQIARIIHSTTGFAMTGEDVDKMLSAEWRALTYWAHRWHEAPRAAPLVSVLVDYAVSG